MYIGIKIYYRISGIFSDMFINHEFIYLAGANFSDFIILRKIAITSDIE